MTRSLLIVLSLSTAGLQAAAEDLDIFGYFEPQYNGLVQTDVYSQFHYNKLRLDILSSALANTEVGADLIGVVYSGKKNWNLFNFLPEHIAATAPPQMLDMYEFSYRDTIFVDNVYAGFTMNRFALTVGKQQISYGTGYFANPTDVFNDKDALDPTYEQTGHTAVRLDMQLKNRLQATVLYAPDEADWEGSTKFVRLKGGVKRFDLGFTLSHREIETIDYYTVHSTEQGCVQIGGDAVGEVIGLGIWGEGTYELLEQNDNQYEFIAGSDYTFESGLYSMIEYHQNSEGKSNHRDYDLNDWMQFLSGQSRTLGRDQAYIYTRYPMTDVLALGGSCIICVSDGSAALVPTAEYSLYENVDLTLMLNFFIGSEGRAYSSKLGNGGFLRANIYF
jgi:hypothetical protein